MQIYVLSDQIDQSQFDELSEELKQNGHKLLNSYLIDFRVSQHDLLDKCDALVIMLNKASNIKTFMFSIGYVKGLNKPVIVLNQTDEPDSEIQKSSIYLSDENISYIQLKSELISLEINYVPSK